MPRKRNAPRRTKGKSEFPGWVLWVVVGVVVIFALFMLARTLTSSTNTNVIIPYLSTNDRDLTALTRMMGEILPDTTRSGLPEELMPRFRAVESLLTERNWPAAIERLRGLVKPTPEDKVALVHELLGFCYHQSASPDRALSEFRMELATAPGDSTRRFRAAFCAGYLFQSRGMADSALVFYQQARPFAPIDTSQTLVPALLNNLGLAQETVGDTAAALAAYHEAATLVDTTVDSRGARVLRDNLRRLTTATPAGN